MEAGQRTIVATNAMGQARRICRGQATSHSRDGPVKIRLITPDIVVAIRKVLMTWVGRMRLFNAGSLSGTAGSAADPDRRRRPSSSDGTPRVRTGGRDFISAGPR